MIRRVATPLLLAACSSGDASGGWDQVELRFAWPESGHARVHETKLKDGVRVESEFEIRWEPGAEAGTTEVIIADMRILTWNGKPWDEEASAALEVSLASMGMSLDAVSMTLVIDEGGQLLDTLGVEEMIGKMSASTAERGVLDEAERAESERRMNTEAARQLMGAVGTKTWNPWVGAWAGLEVPLDGSVREEVHMPVPGAIELISVQQRITGLGVSEDAEGRWLHLQLENVYDPDSMREAMLQMFASIDGTATPGETIPEMERTDHLEVVTDLDSLRPRKAMFRTELRVGTDLRKEQRRWEFDWSPEPR